MESLDDSNYPSMSDSLSLYERYMRSFQVVDKFDEDNNRKEQTEPVSSSTCDYESSNSGGNIDLSAAIQADVDKHCLGQEGNCNSLQPLSDIDNFAQKPYSSSEADLPIKAESSSASLAVSSLETSSATADCLLNDKSNLVDIDARVSSESKSESFKHSVFITSTMENSNNAVDSVPLFRDVRHTENIFKLPISELSFNGTIKHVQKLKPIVDPITALSTVNPSLISLSETSNHPQYFASSNGAGKLSTENNNSHVHNDTSNYTYTSDTNKVAKITEISVDSQCEEFNSKKACGVANEDGSNYKWNLEHSYSSLETSFDSVARSPDLFADDDDDEECSVAAESFWDFLKDYEAYDINKIKNIEQTLLGILPPPSVTTLKIDVTEMLKKYYCFLPAFNDDSKINTVDVNSTTPVKKVSYIHIPTTSCLTDVYHDKPTTSMANTSRNERCGQTSDCEINTSGQNIQLKMCSEIEARDMQWPDVIKCRYYDIYYNVSKHTEKYQSHLLKYRDRFVGGETDTSVNIYSGGLQSPNSASKRKALRLQMAQKKSPGRRLSHLARRRQAFCSAATINEKARATTAKMVLIDKRKLISSAERKSLRTRRTPGKTTPKGKTPAKKTPSKTPKTKTGGSSKKKAMRRLLLDTDNLTRSQPTRETLKRALFISPENKKSKPNAASTSVPHQAIESRRTLFSSPERTAETKSMDGTISDQFLKRKRDYLDEDVNRRSKIAKSLSFSDYIYNRSESIAMNRRASEVLSTKNTSEFDDTRKKKLLWAVSEALRIHGWRMSSPGFKEKASSLAQLTRRLFTLPSHAAKLASPKLSTSETMLKLARQYVFAIIQGRTVDECFQDEQIKLAQESKRISGYISEAAYQQLKERQVQAPTTLISQIKENTCSHSSIRQEQPKSTSKNILQDKLVNIDTNSNSSSGISIFDKIGLYKSNSMPSFEDAAKMRAKRQISFDNVDFPNR